MSEVHQTKDTFFLLISIKTLVCQKVKTTHVKSLFQEDLLPRIMMITVISCLAMTQAPQNKKNLV
jgi:hypothetical protein